MSNLLKSRIQEDMKTAMREKDQTRLATIRMLWAAVRQVEIDQRITLDDTQTLAVIEKLIRQRQDSITQFAAAKRDDLVQKETKEVQILKAYLPEQLEKEQVEEIIAAAIKTTNATTIKDMGKVMAEVKPKLQGRADMGEASNRIKTLLQQN